MKEIIAITRFLGSTLVITNINVSKINSIKGSKNYDAHPLNSKINVFVNLTTKTSEYRVDVSPLSFQYVSGFLLSLLSTKSKHIFLKIFPSDLEKFIF